MDDTPERRRWRYVGFRVDVEGDSTPDRNDMVVALDRASRAAGLPDRKRLTVFTGHLGIARCGHTEQEVMIRALASITVIDGRPARVETVITSGTIKKVKAHLGLDARV